MTNIDKNWKLNENSYIFIILCYLHFKHFIYSFIIQVGLFFIYDIKILVYKSASLRLDYNKILWLDLVVH